MRLIDADAFEDDMCNLWMQNEISNGDWIGFREMLNSQETVVEFDGDINKVIVKGVEYFPQKTGTWINCKYPLGECSECHKIINIQANEAIYCPCCGASMRSEEE